MVVESDKRYLVVMGSPGAGKGTQAVVIAEGLSVCHLSTGELLREALAQGTPLGRQADGYMQAGELVPDDVILGLVDEELDRPSCLSGAVFDGFPRTVEQARGLDELLKERGSSVERVIMIDVPEEEVVRRLSGRRVCTSCDKMYHLSFDPSQEEGRCDACGRDLVQRPDDQPETIKRRLAVYREETEPVLQYYEPRQGVTQIAGDAPIDVVAATIREHLSVVESES